MTPWPTNKLGEVVDSLGGGTPSRSNPEYFKGDIPWITVTDLTDDLRVSKISDARQHITKEAIENSSANLIPAGAVVLATRVAVGKVGITTRAIATNQDCTSFIPHESILPEFLAVLLLANRELIKRLSRGIGIMGVRRKDLTEIKILLPPLSEQKKIVEKIEILFAKINEASRLRAESSEAAAALLPSALHQVFSRAEKEGWLAKTIGDIAKVKGGKRIPKGENFSTVSTKYPYIRVIDFDKFTVNLSDLRFVTEEIFKKISRYTISKDDVYISIAGTIGRVGTIPEELDGSNLTENAAKIVIDDERSVDKKFLVYFLESHSGKSQIIERIKQLGQPKLALVRIKTIKISLPPIAKQKKIVAYLDTLSAKARELQKLQSRTIQDFSALRQSILHQAFK